jgi:hypothetical protein
MFAIELIVREFAVDPRCPMIVSAACAGQLGWRAARHHPGRGPGEGHKG